MKRRSFLASFGALFALTLSKTTNLLVVPVVEGRMPRYDALHLLPFRIPGWRLVSRDALFNSGGRVVEYYGGYLLRLRPDGDKWEFVRHCLA